MSDNLIITQNDEIATDRFTFQDHLDHCWKGGKYSNFVWFKPNKVQWIETDKAYQIPTDDDTYYGINPTNNIPEKNANGQKVSPNQVRTRSDLVAATNVFFAEFDNKDFPSKEATLKHISNLEKQPTVIIASGGGYHCYWYLKETYQINDDNRSSIKQLMAAWVDYVQGDKASKDLARVLRVPGTKNTKPDYKPNYPTVEVITYNKNAYYDFEELTELIDSEGSKEQVSNNCHIRIGQSAKKTQSTKQNIREIEKNLKAFDLDRCDDYKSWLNVGMALKSGLGNDGFALWDNWSQQSEKYNKKELERVWSYFKDENLDDDGSLLGLGSILFWAKQDKRSKVNDDSDELNKENLNGFVKLSDLMNMQFEEINWIVPDLLPEGVFTLAGRPKVGKSWLALQLATVASNGGLFLGKDVIQQKVLYIASEDNPRRFISRVEKQALLQTDEQIDIHFDWPKFVTGSLFPGLDAIEKALEERFYSLIVLDTLNRLLGDVDQNKQEDMLLVYDRLQKMAMKYGACILIIDHQKKSKLGDPIDDILGSTAKSSTVDGVWGLYKDNGNHVLKITGREVMEQDLQIVFNQDRAIYEEVGLAAIVKPGTKDYQVYETLAAMGESTAKEIAEEMGQDTRNVRRSLRNLVTTGVVTKNEGRPETFEAIWIEEEL